MDRGCAIAFALAGSLAFPAARPATRASAPEAKFTAEILPAGTKLVVGSLTVRNQVTFKLGSEGMETVLGGTESATTNFTATVVQSDQSIDRLKIDFGNCPFATTVKLKNPPRELAVAHKSYEMHRKDGKSVFTGPDGKEVPDLERLSAQPHFLPLTFELPLAHLLAGKTLKKGDVLDVPFDAAASLLAPYRTAVPGGTAKLTFTEDKVLDGQECGVFTIAARLPQLGNAQFGSRVAIDVTGEISVTKRHGLVVLAKCEGTYTFPDAKAEKGSGGSKPPAKDEKGSRKGALPKETWSYYLKPG
jgi:hypothetical protein